MQTRVTDAPDRRRYEARDADDGDRLAGFAEYLRTEGMITFTHTEVEPDYEGKGVGSALVRTALDEARAQGVSVLPVCPYVSGWIRMHPEYADLVYE